MPPPARSVTPETLGAWLLKANPATSPVDELVRTGFGNVTGRCIAGTYRAALVAAGQPVLLWVSGSDPRTPSGIYAQGRATGSAQDGHELVMPVELEPVHPPIPRAEIIGHPLLAHLEVVRMPAGSNPSFLTREQLGALAEQWPQVRGH